MGEQIEESKKDDNAQLSEVLINGDDDNLNKEEEEEILLDLSNHFVKPDYFENCHILDPSFETIEGAPNFRKVAGFPIFGMGQPTEEAISQVLKTSTGGVEGSRVLWFMMRQEPLVYINGRPFAPRAPENPHMNLMVKLLPEQIPRVSHHLEQVLLKRLSCSPDTKTIKIHTDKEFAENPMERVDQEETLLVESIQAADRVFKSCADKMKVDLKVIRIPMIEDMIPSAEDLDSIISAISNEKASTPCIFSCQMGKGRTTVGMTLACLIKEVQITTELKSMEQLGLVTTATMKNLICEKFERLPEGSKEEDDPFVCGMFEVIKELLAALPESIEGKRKIDIVIDKCGPPPRGIGIQNLRETIIETKWKYDVASEDKQVGYKQMIINFLERYFYMICYATYIITYGPEGYPRSFANWINEHQNLVEMAGAGKGNLEWSRTVDAAKLDQLRELMADPNYKDNLAVLIRTIYDFAFITYADLPRGPIKNNSMRKLAASTLMEILPPDLAEKVNKKLDESPGMTQDFLTLVGMVSYF